MGKYEVNTTDINALVKNSIDMFGRARQQLEIVQHYQEGVWPVEVDRGQIEQVLLNLLTNAWQAMPEGGTLTLATVNATLTDKQASPHGVEAGDFVVITLTATGIGMEPAVLERIFDPFFTTKGMGRGTGLGLASAYGIVGNHGGLIDVYSRKRQGTTFRIHLKASSTPPAEVAPPEASTLPGDETILLVDDDALIPDVNPVTGQLRGCLRYAGSLSAARAILRQPKPPRHWTPCR